MKDGHSVYHSPSRTSVRRDISRDLVVKKESYDSEVRARYSCGAHVMSLAQDFKNLYNIQERRSRLSGFQSV